MTDTTRRRVRTGASTVGNIRRYLLTATTREGIDRGVLIGDAMDVTGAERTRVVSTLSSLIEEGEVYVVDGTVKEA